VNDDLARRLFPQIEPLDFDAALHLALGRVENDDVETSWMDAMVVSQGDVRPVTLTVSQGMMLESRRLVLDLPPAPVFRAYTGLGGERGWLYLNWTWRIRGWADKLIATRMSCASARPSISGAWRPWNLGGCSACAPR
jgi:hypothetical protein